MAAEKCYCIRKIYFLAFLLPVLIIFYTRCSAQQHDTLNIKNIVLDSYVVKSGFDMKAFVHRVQNDTTFYKAFRSLHLVPFTATDTFIVYDKHGMVIASMNDKAKQIIDSRGCRIATFADKNSTGDFYDRNGDLNYYTAKLFYDAFYSTHPVCDQNDIVAGALAQQGSGRLEKNKYELKQLIFNPGSKVKGVPFMGDKASVFDADQVDKYDFKVSSDIYEGQDTYVFEVTPKPEYKNAVVYSELKTWFRRSDFSIVARNYSLSYSTLLYDFDVHMQVHTRQIGDKLYPVSIAYDGDWHVATQKRERMRVLMKINY